MAKETCQQDFLLWSLTKTSITENTFTRQAERRMQQQSDFLGKAAEPQHEMQEPFNKSKRFENEAVRRISTSSFILAALEEVQNISSPRTDEREDEDDDISIATISWHENNTRRNSRISGSYDSMPSLESFRHDSWVGSQDMSFANESFVASFMDSVVNMENLRLDEERKRDSSRNADSGPPCHPQTSLSLLPKKVAETLAGEAGEVLEPKFSLGSSDHSTSRWDTSQHSQDSKLTPKLVLRTRWEEPETPASQSTSVSSEHTTSRWNNSDHSKDAMPKYGVRGRVRYSKRESL